MKRRFVALLLFAACLLLPLRAALSETGQEGEQPEPEGTEAPDISIADGVNAWMGELELQEWEAFLDTLPEQVQTLWADVDLETLIGAWAQNGSMDDGLSTLLGALAALAAGEARTASGLLLLLLGLSFLSGFVHAFTAGKEGGVQETAGFVCRCFALTAVLGTSLSSVALALSCMDALVQFMQIALPVLMMLLTAVGGVASVGVFQPAMTVLCGTVTGIMRAIVVPLSVAGGAIGLVGSLGGRASLGEMSGLMKRVAKWTIGATSTLYIGVTAVRGMTAATYDGVTMRTAKYAASSLVPMVGGMVSGTMDTMLGCALLVKNAAGLAAILLTMSVVLMPVLRLVAQMFLLRLASALAEPIAGPRLPAMFGAAADMLSFLLAATLAVTLMFLLTIGLMTGIGSVPVAG